MFRIKKINTVTTGNEIDGSSTDNIGLTSVENFIIEVDNTVIENTEILLASLTMQEVDSEEGSPVIDIPNVTKIKIDNRTGAAIKDIGGGQVLIDIGSHFSKIIVEGQDSLVSKGRGDVEFIAGDNIDITTSTGSLDSPKNSVTLSTVYKGIYVIDARDDSPQIHLFLDMIENPQNYKGAILYLTDLGPTERPDPFLWKDKFYFNEGSEWFESPLAIGRVLDDL